MKKYLFLIFAVLTTVLLLFVSIVLLAGCASTAGSGSIPDWMTDYRTVYPETQYIAQRGRADSEQTAKTEAVAQIARYFQTSVNANLKTSIQSVTSGDSISETTSVVNDVDVMSQVDLFAVEYTDPYYFNKEKKWYCVAYIERDKAWNQYQPTVENAKTEFYSMKKKADAESDPLTKCSLYGKSWYSGKKFLEKLEYARILNSQKERAYSDDRKTVSEVPALIAGEKEKCTVYLDVKGDWGNVITSSLSKTLSDQGFKIAKNPKEANYTAHTEVENNAIGNDPIQVQPSLDLKIVSRTGKTVFANQTKSEKKTIAYTLENAQKKAYPLLAEECEKSISTELSKLLGK
ncbi:LPP20 family lipoprotein [uncultured Treponema sp.]|uniref:LPP20 family lipoprotein n=1 Tax=uncultured Treponema sp. TaxID=162155 RepID=UPI0025D892AE|nr:LPP20 family lipoprotein [uncultured Treponema sp.]